MRARGRLGHGGFALFELLVTLAISVITIGSVASVSVLVQGDAIENRLLHELRDDMRFTLEVILPHLRMSSQLYDNGDNSYTAEIPPELYRDGEFRFGFNPSQGSVWVRHNNQPICSRIAELTVSRPDNNGLVALTMVSVDTMPGARQGLPITISAKIMLRNYVPEP